MIKMLSLTNFTKDFVVEDEYLNREILSFHCFKFLNIHLKTAITRDAIYRFALICNSRTYGKWESTTHGTITTTYMNSSLVTL